MFKRIVTTLSLLCSSSFIPLCSSSQAETPAPPFSESTLLSDDEVACFEWFEQSKNCLSCELLQNIPQQEKDFIDLPYDLEPKKVEHGLNAVISLFYNKIAFEGHKVKHSREELLAIFIKIKKAMQNTYLKERLHAFFGHMTTEERATYRYGSYTKDPQAADAAIKKHANLLVNFLAPTEGFKNLEESKVKFVEEFIAMKTEELKAACS